MIKHGSPPLINALSTLMLATTFLAVAASQRLAAGTQNLERKEPKP
jgi:ABC-type spermidine/putrescine transport system permease subunit II